LLTLDQNVPQEFKQRLTEKLLQISDFLHLIIKDKVPTNFRAGSDNGSHSSDDEDDRSEHASSNITELFNVVNSLQA